MAGEKSTALVLGCGMTTAVGMNALASCAAVRAGIDGFVDSEFTGLSGEPLLCAKASLIKEKMGVPRLAELVASPIRECLQAGTAIAVEDVPLLLGVAEKSRPGRLEGIDTGLIPLIEQRLGVKFHPRSRVVPRGKTSGAIAIREATRLLHDGDAPCVIVAGVDSYIVSDTLDYFEDNDRLLTENNSNGFIPGEAGAAILLGSNDGGPGLHIRSIAGATEHTTIHSDQPLRADGLSKAYREALADAGLGLHEVDYRIADLSGEQYGFKETALALARVMRVRREFQDIWHPADCLGETGAAATLCMVGIAWWAACKSYAPGPLVLMQASSDEGTRIAMVMDGRNVGFRGRPSAASRSN